MIIDKTKDYYRACKGFTINGIKYKRLLGTNGGIKNSTIVFVCERLSDELQRRVNNNRDQSKELVTAKLEAYKALTCSASNPVSLPNGILVVEDAETEFLSDIIYITDEEDGEPIMEERHDEHITMNASDGFGLMMPALAERWSNELELDYTVSGLNTRFSFEKGMVFTFDFVDFAEKVAGSYIVSDAWGDEVDIRNIELILTTSMVKLWDSYKSCEDYVNTSIANGYTFGIAKVCPETLENQRNLNYQFIQSYDLTDEDIDELIAPTMREINDVLNDDWRKTILFLKGVDINGSNIESMTDDYAKAIMIDNRILDDTYVKNSIFQLIRNRIDEAKVGVLRVHGNFSIVSGDPYLLCQSIFGLPKTGLLGAGEIYNEYWADSDSDDLACFRAPMTCHNNIRLVHPSRKEDVRYWYKYLHTSTVFNSWDTATAALNGCDFDGDLVMLTDNHVLVSKLTPLPALMCVQRRAQKKVPSEEDFIRSNIDSFGNDIGTTTNWITSMFEVRAGFDPGTKEYEALSYRIKCGQLLQQNSIDRSKGIIAKPMAKEWHDRHAVNKMESDEDKRFYRSIVADRKPYFMKYIYPSLKKQYNTFIKNTDKNALREFQMTVSELKSLPESERTDRQDEFLRYYDLRMPVGTNDCVMNRVCKRFEEEFNGYIGRSSSTSTFDYSIMKSDAEYTPRQYAEIKRLYDEYNKRLSNYSIIADYERIYAEDSAAALRVMDDEFRSACDSVCPNAMSLCNIILDLCYTHSSTKRFAWSMCGSEIIHNLLSHHDGNVSYPVRCDSGDIEFGGDRFTVETRKYEVGI